MCLKKTKKGDRAVVYESGSDGRGIFFIIDYSSGVYKSYDGVKTSYGMMTYLPKNITHTELCKNEKLKKVFQFPRGKRSLDKDVSDELNKIISNLPDFQKMDVPEDIEEIIANVWYPYKEKHKQTKLMFSILSAASLIHLLRKQRDGKIKQRNRAFSNTSLLGRQIPRKWPALGDESQPAGETCNGSFLIPWHRSRAGRGLRLRARPRVLRVRGTAYRRTRPFVYGIANGT